MKQLMCALVTCFTISGSVTAAGKVNYLNVETDKVYFSTTAPKVAASPACAVSEQQDKWAVSLASETGRAMYSLLITAMAGSLPIDVVSANDCADVVDIERPAGVSIVPQIQNAASSGGGLYLYKGDGTTKLGYVLGPFSSSSTKSNTLMYIPISGRKVSRFVFPVEYPLYYASENCQGEAFVTSRNYGSYNNFYQDGKIFKSEPNHHVVSDTASRLLVDGVCEETIIEQAYLYKINIEEHNLCGDKPCLVKDN